MNWHRWFAWYPVVTVRGAWAWMKFVERALNAEYMQANVMLGINSNEWEYGEIE